MILVIKWIREGAVVFVQQSLSCGNTTQGKEVDDHDKI